MTINRDKNDRYLYVASHVTAEVKVALVKEAAKRRISVSHLIFVLCGDGLGLRTSKKKR